MIQIESNNGDFEINDGAIKTGSKYLKMVFDSVSEEIIQVYEGDIDYALGVRMMEYLPGSKIKKFDPAPLGDIIY